MVYALAATLLNCMCPLSVFPCVTTCPLPASKVTTAGTSTGPPSASLKWMSISLAPCLFEVPAVVTLLAGSGQVLTQGTTLSGNIQFKRVAASAYTIQVAAPGYESVAKEFRPFGAGTSTVFIDMRPAPGGKTGTGSSPTLLAPKVQKELG